jgi:hypothetical protein
VGLFSNLGAAVTDAEKGPPTLFSVVRTPQRTNPVRLVVQTPCGGVGRPF